jgi:hypothetical protein
MIETSGFQFGSPKQRRTVQGLTRSFYLVLHDDSQPVCCESISRRNCGAFRLDLWHLWTRCPSPSASGPAKGHLRYRSRLKITWDIMSKQSYQIVTMIGLHKKTNMLGAIVKNDTNCGSAEFECSLKVRMSTYDGCSI